MVHPPPPGNPPPPASPPPPQWPPLAPVAVGQLFEIVHGGAHCQLVNGSGGTCVHDGAGDHGSNEECFIRAVEDIYVNATEFDLENYYDFVKIGNIHYSGTKGPSCQSRSRLLTQPPLLSAQEQLL